MDDFKMAGDQDSGEGCFKAEYGAWFETCVAHRKSHF